MQCSFETLYISLSKRKQSFWVGIDYNHSGYWMTEILDNPSEDNEYRNKASLASGSVKDIHVNNLMHRLNERSFSHFLISSIEMPPDQFPLLK